MTTREIIKQTVNERAARPWETLAGLACYAAAIFMVVRVYWLGHELHLLDVVVFGLLLSAGFFATAPLSARSWASSVTTFWKKEQAGEDQG